MQIVVLNGVLSQREQDAYVRKITAKYPMSAINKLFLDVHDDYVDVRFTLHRYRELRKMGGYCIGEPASWNAAKQAELRDMIPNPVEGDPA